MVREYLDGQIDRTGLSLDFQYELEKRYEKMRSEDSEYAELIYDRLLEDGVYRAERLSDEKFRERRHASTGSSMFFRQSRAPRTMLLLFVRCCGTR
jgi:hypothetical protein